MCVMPRKAIKTIVCGFFVLVYKKRNWNSLEVASIEADWLVVPMNLTAKDFYARNLRALASTFTGIIDIHSNIQNWQNIEFLDLGIVSVL